MSSRNGSGPCAACSTGVTTCSRRTSRPCCGACPCSSEASICSPPPPPPVTGTSRPTSVAEIVWSLVDKSLVNVEQREGSTRYRLLETVRAVAASYSESAGDAPARVPCWASTISPPCRSRVAATSSGGRVSRSSTGRSCRWSTDWWSTTNSRSRIPRARLAIEGELGGLHSRDTAFVSRASRRRHEARWRRSGAPSRHDGQDARRAGRSRRRASTR